MARPDLIILNSDARIDLLVTDVGLPGLNGRQLADAARATRPRLRVLFMTGYAEAGDPHEWFPRYRHGNDYQAVHAGVHGEPDSPDGDAERDRRIVSRRALP